MSLGYFEFTVGGQDGSTSVKSFLRRKCGLSARSMKEIKFNGGSILRDREMLRSHDILHSGDVLKVQLPEEESDIEPVKGPLDVLFEDDHLLVVNKPASMPVHPTKIHQLDTLANIVIAYQQSRGERYVFRALNRLDKDTSGCVLLAKDRIAYNLVQPTVQKTYLAVCEGEIKEPGTIDAPISLQSDSKIKRCVRQDGQPAVTHYTPMQYANGHTLCRMRLDTGRTHQIRCHMSYIGHPLAGDDLYGGSLGLIDRQALHCDSIEFIHPVTGQRIHLEAEMPREFGAVMQNTAI